LMMRRCVRFLGFDFGALERTLYVFPLPSFWERVARSAG